MTLYDFYPFTLALSRWCVEQSNLVRFMLEVDNVTRSLVVNLEYRYGQQIYRTNHWFSYNEITMARNNLSLIKIMDVQIQNDLNKISGT